MQHILHRQEVEARELLAPALEVCQQAAPACLQVVVHAFQDYKDIWHKHEIALVVTDKHLFCDVGNSYLRTWGNLIILFVVIGYLWGKQIWNREIWWFLFLNMRDGISIQNRLHNTRQVHCYGCCKLTLIFVAYKSWTAFLLFCWYLDFTEIRWSLIKF